MVASHPREDVELELALVGRAQLLTDLETSTSAAIVELHEMANGRRDLLASAAGSQIGRFLASPRTTDPYHLLAGTLLILAGADTALVKDSVDLVLRWSRAHTHVTSKGAA